DGFRAENGRHRDGLFRRQGLRIASRDLLQVRRERHLLHEIEIVVTARRTVRAEADRYAGLQQLRHRSDAARELHVARWTMRDAYSALPQNADIVIVEPHAVSRDCPPVEQADGIEELRRAHSIFCAAV